MNARRFKRAHMLVGSIGLLAVLCVVLAWFVPAQDAQVLERLLTRPLPPSTANVRVHLQNRLMMLAFREYSARASFDLHPDDVDILLAGLPGEAMPAQEMRRLVHSIRPWNPSWWAPSPGAHLRGVAVMNHPALFEPGMVWYLLDERDPALTRVYVMMVVY